MPTPPAEPTKKKPKYYYEKIKDDGSSASFLTGGYMPVLAPTSAVADAPEVVVYVYIRMYVCIRMYYIHTYV